ncbi:PREDICTED: sulfotransferase family cytosolic 1B member 1-like, partial [Priapulus caudatus]|uniref:Sulfotransferase family cytosolic 1B member 1-like n=1 Tax=Priapulus caudatus TaxID=37621 RepID=A0ABM1F710_PRICU
IIYVIRNPKDNAVSYYYHHKIACFLGPYTGNFQEFMTLYMRGQLLYGSWFDHVKSFWDQRDSDQILFIKYEDMKRDLRGAVRKIMHFMDRELSDDAIDQIVHHCSFAQMKDNPAVNRSKIPIPVFDLKEHRFMRKGIIGDWQNHFNQKQSDAMDEMYREKLASTGLELQWLPDELLKNESSEIDSNENYIKEVDNEGDNGVEATRL